MIRLACQKRLRDGEGRVYDPFNFKSHRAYPVSGATPTNPTNEPSIFTRT